MNRGTAFFDKNIHFDQLGLSELIFHPSYLLTNLKLGTIQDGHKKNKSDLGRPCNAEIRWYDGTDDGLVDIRLDIILRGTDLKVERWHVLHNFPENEELSDTEISEKALHEDWSSKLRMKYVVTMGT